MQIQTFFKHNFIKKRYNLPKPFIIFSSSRHNFIVALQHFFLIIYFKKLLYYFFIYTHHHVHLHPINHIQLSIFLPSYRLASPAALHLLPSSVAVTRLSPKYTKQRKLIENHCYKVGSIKGRVWVDKTSLDWRRG